MKIQKSISSFLILFHFSIATATEYHISKSGADTNDGSKSAPFKTISKAAQISQPGDVITVHEGIYRERIDPPRGGTSDENRIIYQAAPGAKVVIKGSEVVTDWEKQETKNVWKKTIPNTFFGDFNPFADVISGDWYDANQKYTTGAVYLNGHWLIPAKNKNQVLGIKEKSEDTEVLNLEFIRSSTQTRYYANESTESNGVATVLSLPNDKKAFGRIKNKQWIAFNNIDMGEKSKFIDLSYASPVGGGFIEVRKDSPDGELLGRGRAQLTAEWHHFANLRIKIKETSGVQRLVFTIKAITSRKIENSTGYWYAQVDDSNTTIYANFNGIDPNVENVEVNARQSVFYPTKNNIDYLTVRGFILEQSAAPWSAPTAEQIGLIGTNWSKGWLIENNIIRYSACTGLTIGKHGDEYDHTGSYHRSIRLGLKQGWTKNNIGHHIIRNNEIYNNGQGGINGSLGGAFSLIENNEIYNITQNHLYGGCETAGIKLHGAIDVIIRNNHVYNCQHWGGIWLDWMSQGARVSGNLLHGNGGNDFMFEMNHGPMLLDNNISLSRNSLLDASGGTAYVHNIFSGGLTIWSENLKVRKTPYFKPNSTDLAEVYKNVNDTDMGTRFGHTVDQDDDRYYNNILFGNKFLSFYDNLSYNIKADGNVYGQNSTPLSAETNSLKTSQKSSDIKIIKKSDGWWLEIQKTPSNEKIKRQLITSAILAKASLPDATFTDPQGNPYTIDKDYFGNDRNQENPLAGPFNKINTGPTLIKVWPKK